MKNVIVSDRNLQIVWDKLHYAMRKGEAIHTNDESADWLDGVYRTYTDIAILVDSLAEYECVLPDKIKSEIIPKYLPKHENNHSFRFTIGIDDPHNVFEHLQLI